MHSLAGVIFKPTPKAATVPLMAFTPKVAGRLLCKSRKTILRWISEGKLHAVRIDQSYLIPRQSLEELLKGSEVNPGLIGGNTLAGESGENSHLQNK